MKRLITVEISRDADIFDKDLPIVVSYLEQLNRELRKEYVNIWLEHDQYYEGCDLKLMGKRYETDKEYQERLKEEEKRDLRNKKVKETTEKREKALLEKLKKKYE